MYKVGLLTSGGDCAGLNSVLFSLARSLYRKIENVELIGIYDGYTGLIDLNTKVLHPKDFDGLLVQGGTFLRSIRQSFKTIDIKDESGISKADKMVTNYKKLDLDCLITLGGNGTHKIANLLSQRGLNVIGLPKTIDNDIFGTEETFGADTAVQTGVNYIDVLKTTAASHSRVMVVEIMGNKVGWLPLTTGVASDADVVLLPEIPYDLDKVASAIKNVRKERNYAIVVVAEGAYDKTEPKKRKERVETRRMAGFSKVSDKLAEELEKKTGFETRSAVPGHFLRGGTPSAYDRNYSMRLGHYAAELIDQKIYGVTVAKVDGKITHNRLIDIAGKSKPVDLDTPLLLAARDAGVFFGE